MITWNDYQLFTSLAIGTVCYNDGVSNAASCIDAYGTTSSSYPSATTGFVLSATPVAIDDPGVLYSPANAWSSSSTVPNCTSSGSLRVTSTINSTVSFNYTGKHFLLLPVNHVYTLDPSGPSIMVHVVTTPQGGVFSVFVDDFDTMSTLDTFSDNNTQLPLCYPVQFPPFTASPPGLASRNQHSITLMYTGPSPNAPNGTTSASVQFDSFSIPIFKSSSSAAGTERSGLTLLTFSVSIYYMSNVVNLLAIY